MGCSDGAVGCPDGTFGHEEGPQEPLLNSTVPPRSVLSELSFCLPPALGREVALIRANYGVQTLCLIALINY